jgi:hypothetical protein
VTATSAAILAGIIGLIVSAAAFLVAMWPRGKDEKAMLADAESDTSATQGRKGKKKDKVQVQRVKMPWYKTFGQPGVDLRLGVAAVLAVVMGIEHFYVLAIVLAITGWVFVDTFVTTAPAQQQIEKLRDLGVFISALIATATGGGNLSLPNIIRSAMSSNPDNRFVLSRASLYTRLLEPGTDPEQRQQILEELIMVADDQPSRMVDSVVMLTASNKTQSVAPLLADLNEMLANQLSTYETAYRNFVLSDISNARVMLAMALIMVVGIAIYTAPTYAAHLVASLVVQLLIAVSLAFLIMIVGSARRPFIVKSWFV